MLFTKFKNLYIDELSRFYSKKMTSNSNSDDNHNSDDSSDNDDNVDKRQLRSIDGKNEARTGDMCFSNDGKHQIFQHQQHVAAGF